eukprot:2648180-Lingulodinium_polyedra.AAC.1
MLSAQILGNPAPLEPARPCRAPPFSESERARRGASRATPRFSGSALAARRASCCRTQSQWFAPPSAASR